MNRVAFLAWHPSLDSGDAKSSLFGPRVSEKSKHQIRVIRVYATSYFTTSPCLANRKTDQSYSALRSCYRSKVFNARFWARTKIFARSTSKADVMRSSVSRLGLCTFCSTKAIVCLANPAFRAMRPSDNFCFSRCSFKRSATWAQIVSRKLFVNTRKQYRKMMLTSYARILACCRI